MSRTLTAPIPTVIAQPTVRAIKLLRFTAGGTTYYFAESRQTIGGHLYLPYLGVETGPRFTRSITGKTCRLRLDNIDLATAAVLKAQRDVIQGAPAALVEYFLEAAQEVAIMTGTIGELTSDEQNAALTINGVELATSQTPMRVYANLCTEKFKNAACGYVGASATCDKTFAACTGFGRTHRFNGFLQLTRDLTDAVAGAAGSNVVTGGGGSGDPGANDRLLAMTP